MTPSDNDWCTHHTHTHTFKVCIQHIGDGRDHDLAPLSPHAPHATSSPTKEATDPKQSLRNTRNFKLEAQMTPLTDAHTSKECLQEISWSL